jgi:hypothetical protein
MKMDELFLNHIAGNIDSSGREWMDEMEGKEEKTHSKI